MKFAKLFKESAKPLQANTDSLTIQGHFDGINHDGMIYGWAFAKQIPEQSLTVELVLNGESIAATLTDLPRRDVSSQLNCHEFVGFEFDLKKLMQSYPIQAGDQLDIKINQHILSGSPVLIDQSIQYSYKLGFCEGVSANGFIEGWAFDQQDLSKSIKIYLHIDNLLITEVIADLYRHDVANSTDKKNGRAGFSIPFILQENQIDLLKIGAKITLSFDADNQYLLPNATHIITAKILQSILLGILKYSGDPILSDKQLNFIKILLNSFDNYREIEEDSDLAAVQKYNINKIDYPLLSITLIRIAFRLKQLSNYAELLDFLADWQQPDLLSYCQLEKSIFTVIALTAIGKLTETAIIDLDSHYFERSQSELEKKHSQHFNKYIDPVVTQFCGVIYHQIGLLPTSSIKNAPELLAKLAFVFSRWSYRLNANPQLAFSFLLLLQDTSTTLFNSLEVQNHAAHLRRELQDSLGALIHCLNAIQQETDYWWIYHETAVIMRVLAEHQVSLFRQSLETIYHRFYLAFQLNPYQNKSFREFDSALKAYFSVSHGNTWQLAESGFIQDALTKRQDDLNLLNYAMGKLYSGEFHQLKTDNAISHRPKAIGYKILFIGSRGLYQCYYYRVRQKLEQAQQLELETDYVDLGELGHIDWQKRLMNVVVLYACRIPATITEIKLLNYAKSLGIAIVYDIDDLIFDASHFPAALETYAGTIDEKTHLHLTMDNPFFATALTFADIGVASTHPLAEAMAKHISVPIHVHPNVFSYELYDLAKMRGNYLKNHSDKISVLYGSATKAHKQSFYTTFLPAILAILDEYPQVQLILIGYFDNIPETKYAQQIKILPPTSSFMGYINLLKDADINIAILEQSPLTDTKSEIKWLEAAAFEIPSIVTPTLAYQQVLTDNENVLFAETIADWQRQLQRLIIDSDLRRQIGIAAKRRAFEKFSPQTGEDILQQTLQPLLSQFPLNKNCQIHSKKRLLLVNVYFYPQSIGGATRVFENQVRGLLDRYANEYEIFVLTTEADPDIGKPYFVEQYWFQQALITRLNIPPKGWTQYEDQSVYQFSLEFFKDYEFDLIHFHSIQILTASVVQAAIKLKIPYMITLHDAWWLSIYQFLVNPEGELVDHRSPLSGVCGNDVEHMEWIVTRWRQLQQLLSKANVVMAVSEKFAQLYREAGQNQVQVHENYAEPFQALPRPIRNSSQIVLGFIGGMSTHKGYDLFKAALQQGDFPNLTAIVINHSLQTGEVHYSQWGATKVEFRAKVKQSEVAELYAQFDVLVAPSIWPESYGLVTREALQAGLWVIASDRGAIGDCIIEGVNGNIVNVNDENDLIRVFQQLPEQFSHRSFVNSIEINSSENDQAIELHFSQLTHFYQTALGIKL